MSSPAASGPPGPGLDAGLDADLVVIGFGPTGATLAGLAARRGLRVIVVDAVAEIFPLPRAVQCDHEVLRILQELGCADEVLAGSILNDGLDFLAADGRVLLSFTVPPITADGWPSSIFFHQPTFEAILRRTVRGLGVEARLGTAVADVAQDEAGAWCVLEDGTRLRARHVVGADGARSTTRRAIGAAMRDSGFEEPWLVVDLVLGDGVAGLPTRCLQVCDPARPHTLVPMPGRRFRFEFMLLPGEDPDDLLAPRAITALLGAWLEPDAVEIERAAVYTFHGLVAETWRAGRVFLAGDAAHQTPPFLGQGMCAGMRDAANLAWKLAAVRDGAPDALLDTYGIERDPHAQAVIDAAVAFGRLICELDPDAAAQRDAAMAAGPTAGGEAPDPIPPLRPGPGVGPGGGALAAQPTVGGVRLDDLVGPRHALVTAAPLAATDPRTAWWRERAALLDAASHPALEDLLAGHEALAVRPDRHVLAAGTFDAVTDFAQGLLGA